MLVAVEVDVDNGGTVGLNGLLLAVDDLGLVVVLIMETFPAIIRAVDSCTRVSARTGDDADRAADILVGNRNSFYKVIKLVVVFIDAVDALLPDDDGIVGLRLRSPARINCGFVADRIAEHELRRIGRVVGMLLGVEPAAEFIAHADHGTLGRVRVDRLVVGLQKTRGVIGSLAAFRRVFVIDQPLAARRVDREDDIAGDRDLGAVFIDLSGRVVGNIAAAFTYQPALKVVQIVRRGIDLVDGVALRITLAGQETDFTGAEYDILVAQIVDKVRLADNGVVVELCVRIGQSAGFRLHFRADRVDTLCRLGSICAGGLCVGPAIEYFLIAKHDLAARVIHDLLDVGFGIIFLDVHRVKQCLAVVVVELHGNARRHGRNNDIDGEALAVKAGAVCADAAADSLKAACSLGSVLVQNGKLIALQRFLEVDADMDALVVRRLQRDDMIVNERAEHNVKRKSVDNVRIAHRAVGVGHAVLRIEQTDARRGALGERAGIPGNQDGGLVVRRRDVADQRGHVSKLSFDRGRFVDHGVSRGLRLTDVPAVKIVVGLLGRRSSGQLAKLLAGLDLDALDFIALGHELDRHGLLRLLGGLGILRIHGGLRLIRIHSGLRLIRIHGRLRLIRVHGGLRLIRVYGGLRLIRVHGRLRLIRVHGGLRLIRVHGGLGLIRFFGRVGLIRLFSRIGLIRLFSRIRILRKLDHIIILVSAVVQAGGQGLIAGPQYHQQGKQKREYALRQFVHLMRASYSYTWRRIAPPRFIYCVMGFASAVSLGFAVYIEVAMLFPTGLGLRFAGGVFRSFAYFSLFSSACALE